MATPEEIAREKELLKLKEKRLQLDKQEVRESDSYSNALRDQLKGVKQISAEKAEILSIDRRLNKMINDNYSTDLKALTTQKGLAGIQKQIAQAERDQLILKQKMGTLDASDEKRNASINKSLRIRIKQSKDLVKAMQEQAKLGKEISKNSSVRLFGGLAGIADTLGLDKIAPELQEAQDAASEQALSNISSKKAAERMQADVKSGDLSDETGKGLTQDKVDGLAASYGKKAQKMLKGKSGTEAGKIIRDNFDGIGKMIKKSGKGSSVFMAGFKKLGPIIKKAIGPLAILLEIFQLDKQTADMAKSMNMTYKEAQGLRKEMTFIALESENNFLTGKKVAETFSFLNNTLGVTSTKMDQELLTTMTELREMAGMTNEELMGLAMISTTTGEDMKDVTGEFMASAKAAGLQNGVMVNTKTLSKDLSKLSAATTLSLGKNPKLLGEALATTKALGMEMSQLDGIASSLMDFESSIKNELEAELLLGKNLNLEKARQAALNNDLSTLASEIAEQAGTAAEFGEMNRIQQEAIAKAVGMGRDELAQTLYVQEQLAGATGEEAAEQEAILNARIAEVGLAQAQKEMAKDGFEGLKNQAGMADRMAAAMDKLNEVFVTIVEAAMPFLDVLVSVFDIIGKITKFIDPMVQTVMVGVAAIQDLVSGIGWLFGDEDAFSGGSAIVNQGAAAEASAQRNWGFSGNAQEFFAGEGGGIRDRSPQMRTGGTISGPESGYPVTLHGAETVVPLDPKGIKVDNRKMENTLDSIAKHLAGLNNAPIFTINRG